jgi:cell division protein FtsA
VEQLNVAKRHPKPRTGLIAALDIGTSKVCCMVARVDRPAGEDAARQSPVARVVGVGHQVSAGIRSGVVTDMDAAEAAIRQAVHAAEQMAGETIQDVTVNLSGGKPSSETVSVDVAVGGHEVAESDLQRVIEKVVLPPRPARNGTNGHAANGHNGAANGHANGPANGKHADRRGDRELIHTIPIAYALDGDRGIRDPRGMFGETLGVQVHLISAAAGPVQTLRMLIERCHLDVEEFVVSPYAAGLAALVEDETDLGVTVLDMGAGTTDLGVFYDGRLIFADTIPVGGGHVTNDIARGLSTPIAHAERLKTLHGNAVASIADEHDLIDVPQVGEDIHATPNHVPCSILNGIIQPRMEETFELVRAHLKDSGVAGFAGRRVVLTGGASQLQGVRELATLILDKQVRMGRPLRLRGLAEAMAGPAFVTSAGLIAHAISRPETISAPAPVIKGEPTGLTGRVGAWLRDHF